LLASHDGDEASVVGAAGAGTAPPCWYPRASFARAFFFLFPILLDGSQLEVVRPTHSNYYRGRVARYERDVMEEEERRSRRDRNVREFDSRSLFYAVRYVQYSIFWIGNERSKRSALVRASAPEIFEPPRCNAAIAECWIHAIAECWIHATILVLFISGSVVSVEYFPPPSLQQREKTNACEQCVFVAVRERIGFPRSFTRH